MKSAQQPEPESAPRFLVCGLGNVGAQYQNTRHNIGFDVIDALALKLGLSFVPGPGDYYVASNVPQDQKPPSRWRRWLGLPASPALVDGPPAVLIRPTTYMNRSGRAAAQALTRYQLPAERLLVVCDDFHLPLGAVRLRKSGSDGGHNGLKSLITELETEEFPRLRLGIGPKPQSEEIVTFVLGRFGPAAAEARQAAVGQALTAILYLLAEESANSLDLAASKYNISRPDPAPGSGGAGK
ncbi:MAG TPA: aminoacyl-tRNA hydrolase [candidate division Zixibacteria bacterium]|nr:aminoacyl-tRNA hydrolase [candidate division Zixibacteria bacterium]